LRRLLGLGGFGRIHLASHVQIGANAADGLLLTADGGMALDELQRLIARQRYGAAPLDLLTLSACSTAVGDRRAALGLGGLAVQSGARSALASLWQVSDAATGRLMRAFYSRLDGDGKARALQCAQNELIDAGLGHPFYWAGFVLIGNWE
jgi:CHAT domain-containing protein